MKRNQRNFLVVAFVSIIISLLIALGYHKYQEKKLKKSIEDIANTFSLNFDEHKEEIKKEKGFFTKAKESIFGSEEEKIVENLERNFKEIFELKENLSKSIEAKDSEKIEKKLEDIYSEIEKLQNQYYSLNNKYYEPQVITAISNIEESNLEELNPEDKFKNSLLKDYINKGYSLKNKSLFQKFIAFLGGKKKDILLASDENSKTLKIEIIYDKNKIIVEEYNADKLERTIEFTTMDNFITGQTKIDDKEKEIITTLDSSVDGFGNDNPLKEGFALDEYKDGSRIEYTYSQFKPNGPAVRYFKNGDREEFFYVNGLKHGFSTYYFANGDKEEVYYRKDVLEGKAKYIYADGYVEIYKYVNGQRVE